MNETRRKPTTGRQSSSLFDKWHGIFYMPSHIDKAGHTKAFDYPVAEHWGKAEMFSSAGGTRTNNTSVQSRTCYQLSHPSSPEVTICLKHVKCKCVKPRRGYRFFLWVLWNPPYSCLQYFFILLSFLYSNPQMLIFPCPLNFIVVFSLPN